MLDKGILEESDASLRPPTFATVEEERAHVKARLVGAYRLFNKLGYEHWVAGHISVRDPGHDDRFWVNPLGTSWRLIRPDDLVCVDFDGNVVTDLGGPDVPVKGAAFAIQSQIHRSRPDSDAVAHTHAPHGRAWATAWMPGRARWICEWMAKAAPFTGTSGPPASVTTFPSKSTHTRSSGRISRHEVPSGLTQKRSA